MTLLHDPTELTGVLSLEQQIALLSPAEQEAVLVGLDTQELAYDWRWGARPQQYLDPKDESWAVTLLLAGRGSGKTRSATEWIRAFDEQWASMPERHGHTGDGTLRIGLLSRTAADVRDTLINGPSGLLHIYPPSLADRVEWISSQRRVNLPYGGQIITLSAEEPDQVRGPEFHISLADELAAHRGRPGVDGLTAWDNLRIATRMGRTPQIVAATTPKRSPVMRKLLAEAKDPTNRILLRKMRTEENPYLSESYLAVLYGLYAGTSIGAQELDGEMLDDVQGALVKIGHIDATRVQELPAEFYLPSWQRIVGVDPSVSDKPGDECGIIVAGAKMVHPVHERHAFVVDDRSCVASPAEWSRIVVQTAHEYHASVVVESNQGGAMAAMVIRSAAKEMGMAVPAIRQVWATGSKKTRAEPWGTAYERGRVHHLNVLPEYESQLCFPAGTLITTDRGQVPIEDVSTADQVLTRRGFAPLKKAWQTGESSTLTTITHDAGVIVSTPWHQIWTENRGFVPAMSVLPTDHLVVLPGLTRLSRGAGGGGDALRRATTAPGASSSIVQSGKHTSDRSPQDYTSTIELPAGTTDPNPLNYSPLLRTSQFTTLSGGSPVGLLNNTATTPETSGRNGKARSSRVLAVETRSAAETCVPGSAPNGAATRSTGSNTSPSLLRVPVPPVASASPLHALTASTAPTGAGTGSKPDGGVPVYDLAVADGYPHEFFADGVLVHNCEWVEGESGYSPDRLDAGVWAGMPLLFPESLKGGLPGSARSYTPNRLRTLSGVRQVNVQRSRPSR